MNFFSSFEMAWTGYRVAKGRLPAVRLAQALERGGPAAIKLGQMLATRPDIVGEEVARALEHLQDRLPPFPDAEARRIIEKEFGKPARRVVSPASFGGAPLAAASIAQVHRAVTGQGVGRSGESAPARHRGRVRARPGRFWPFSPAWQRNFSAEARRLRFCRPGGGR